MTQKRRKIHTLSNKPRVEQRLAEPVELSTDEAQPETFTLQSPQYEQAALVKQFEGYSKEYYTQTLELILRHQALRTAIMQVKEVVDKEFVSGFVDLDDELDAGIADAFKLAFFRMLLNDINKHSHPDNPLDVLATLQLLYFPELKLPASPPAQKAPDLLPVVKHMRAEFEKLHNLLRESVGPFGLKGETKGQTNVEPTKSRLVRRTGANATRPRSKT